MGGVLPKVIPHEMSVELRAAFGGGADRRVLVDGSQGALLVDTPTRGVWELGASRAGVQATLELARAELGIARITVDDERVLADAVAGALRRTATRAGMRTPIDRQVDTIRATPLVYARPFLANHWLRDDAERFRPCRIAIAYVEDTAPLDHTPEGVEALVERLARWRDLFSITGKAKKALAQTLNDFGHGASIYALWGLRRVPLERKAPTVAHVEVLGALGQHPSAAALQPHMRIVEHTEYRELLRALEAVPLGLLGMPASVTAAHALPELLARVDVPGDARHVELRDLVEEALGALEEALPRERQTARPPLPLPDVPGLRFLSTVGDVVDEGQAMDHCVATRCYDAVTGGAFLFHVDAHGQRATAQLDADGRVVEVRGPHNLANAAVTTATHLLTSWGAGFWAAALGLTTSTWRRNRPAPPAAQPLVTVEDCRAAAERAARLNSDAAVAAWFKHHVTRAIEGRAWLVMRGDDTLVLDENGRVIAHSADIGRAALDEPAHAAGGGGGRRF